MREQSKIPQDLLPDDDNLNFWQFCVKNAIMHVQENWTPYKQYNTGDPSIPGDGKSGSTENIYFRQKRIMTANKPATSHCCGAVLEVFMRAWKEWMGEDYETDEDMSKETMWEMNRYTFLVPGEHRTIDMVIPGVSAGLEHIAKELDWLDIETKTFTHKTYNQYEPKFADFIQMQFSEDGSRGHTVIVLGAGKYKNKRCLYVWSSNVGYDQQWQYSKGQEAGHGVDYYNIKSVRNGFTRTFHMGRILDD